MVVPCSFQATKEWLWSRRRHNVEAMLVSVVIPAYNAARHIRRSLDSVLAQTYPEFEVIVVDDGSVDQTSAIVMSYTDPRVQLIRQPNAGVSAARNRGIEAARGDWIAFIDADDRWEPVFLETVVSTARRFPNVVSVFTNFRDSVTGRLMIPEQDGEARVLESYFSFLLRNKQGMWSSCVLVHRETLRAIGGFPVGVTHGEDLDTWARLAWSGPIAYVPEPLAIYHTDTEGSAMKMPMEIWLRYPPVVKTFKEWQQSGKIPRSMLSESEAYVREYLFSYVRALLKIGRRNEARDVLVKEKLLSRKYFYYAAHIAATFLPTPLFGFLVRVQKHFIGLCQARSGSWRGK